MAMPLVGCAGMEADDGTDKADDITVGAKERREIMQAARVWTGPVEAISKRNIMAGPDHERKYALNQPVECKFEEPDPESPPDGKTPKFECRDAATGKKIKVKYDETGKKINDQAVEPELFNGEEYAETAGTRLLWALGFGADTMYPVRVTCTDCPEEPFSYVVGKTRSALEFVRSAYRRKEWMTMPRAKVFFQMASIESKFAGTTIEEFDDQGWTFDELMETATTEQSRIEREALIAIMAFVHHADAKAEQQRIYCAKKTKGPDQSETCAEPHLVVHDLGYTFGGGFRVLPATVSKMDIDGWRDVGIWDDADDCELQIHPLPSSDLHDPVISEEGRAFAAQLLNQLTRAQIEDLFRIARVDEAAQVDGDGKVVTIADWADAFEARRRELSENHCR